MPGRTDELAVLFTATDEASAKADGLADKVEKLDNTSAAVKLNADSTQATNELLTLDQKLARLSDADKAIVLKANADQAEREIKRATDLLAKAKTDAEIDLLITARDEASERLEDVQGRMRELDRQSADTEITADDHASADIEEVDSKLRALDGQTAKVKVDTGGIDSFKTSVDGITGGFEGIAGLAGAGGPIALGVGALGTGLFAAAQNAADMAIQVDTTSRLTGDSLDLASRLQAVWQTSGADVNDLNDVMLQMNGVLQQSPEFAKQLGVNLNDGKTIGERFIEVVEAVERSTLGASEKAQLMSNLFGEEGVRQVARLQSVIQGDLQGAIDRVADSQIIDDEDVAKAQEFNQSVGQIGTSVKGISTEFAQGLLPIVTGLAQLADRLGGAASSLRDFSNRGEEEGANLAEQFGSAFLRTIPLVSGHGFWDLFGSDEPEEVNSQVAEIVEKAKSTMLGFIPTIGELRDSLGKVIEKNRQTAVVYSEHAEGLHQLAVQAEEANRVMSSSDWGRAELEGALTANQNYTTQLFALRDIASQTEAAVDTFGESIKDSDGKVDASTLTMDAHTDAGRRQIEAVKGIADSLNVQFAAAYEDADGNMQTFMTRADQISNDTLSRLQTEFGLSDEQVDGLRTTLGLTAKDWQARFEMSGTEDAQIKVGLLQGSIQSVTDKNWQAKIATLIAQGDYVGVVNEVQSYFNQHPATVRVSLANLTAAQMAAVNAGRATGGIAGQGDVAGENWRPEFVNGGLTTGPVGLDAGQQVTGEISTELLFRQLISALERNGGGGQPAPVVHQTTNYITAPDATARTIVRTLRGDEWTRNAQPARSRMAAV